MDPNESLAQLRKGLTQFDRANGFDNRNTRMEERYIAGVQIVDAAEALDGWLSNGGFLPTAWENQP